MSGRTVAGPVQGPHPGPETAQLIARALAACRVRSFPPNVRPTPAFLASNYHQYGGSQILDLPGHSPTRDSLPGNGILGTVAGRLAAVSTGGHDKDERERSELQVPWREGEQAGPASARKSSRLCCFAFEDGANRKEGTHKRNALGGEHRIVRQHRRDARSAPRPPPRRPVRARSLHGLAGAARKQLPFPSGPAIVPLPLDPTHLLQV